MSFCFTSDRESAPEPHPPTHPVRLGGAVRSFRTDGAGLLAGVLLCVLSLGAEASEITPDDLERLPPADVYLLGEIHDNPAHHTHQARAVAALEPAALVFEMLTRGQAARVTAANRQDPEVLAEVLEWEASGWPDFAMYFPIFDAAPQARIRGAALPRNEARAMMAQTAEEAFGPEAASFGLDQPLSEDEQASREALQAAAHCDMLPDELLPAMVEIQRLRDAMLARTAMLAHAETGGPVVVITGTGHVRRDQGVPLKLARAAPGITVLALGQLEAAPDSAPPFDLWIVTDPVDRPDPCEAFR